MPEFMGRERAVRLATAPSSPQVGELYYDTAANILYWWNGTAWISASGASQVNVSTGGPTPRVGELLWVDTDEPLATSSGISLVTSLPTTPYDGQEVIYQADATNGINWHLRYRAGSASAYKWEFLGGPPLLAYVAALDTSTGINGAYGALTNAGPSIALPRAGDYIVEIGCSFGSDVTGTFAYMSYDIGATGAVDADSISTGGNWVSGTNVYQVGSRAALKTGLSAVTLTAKYKRSAGNTVGFEARWMRVEPVRLS